MKTDIFEDRQMDAFWAEMSACEHFVHLYEGDEMFLDTLAGFVRGGFATGQAAVVIATPGHRQELDRRLAEMGLDVASARSEDQFISLDAEETLAKFMVNGWPDEKLFGDVISDVLERATGNGRKVRAFGEMVALLWAQGHCGATVRLEHLWTAFGQRASFALFCAYPKAGFTQGPDSIASICAAHSKVLEAVWSSPDIVSSPSPRLAWKAA